MPRGWVSDVGFGRDDEDTAWGYSPPVV